MVPLGPLKTAHSEVSCARPAGGQRDEVVLLLKALGIGQVLLQCRLLRRIGSWCGMSSAMRHERRDHDQTDVM
jgi:hypothetical protein